MDGSFYRILVSPVRRSSIVMGHILDAAMLSFIEIVPILGISFLMAVRVASGGPGLILMALLLFANAFFMASLSYLVSLLLPDMNAFHTLMNSIVLPVFFVSTALIPRESIPAGFQTVVALNPFTHVIDSLRNLILTPAIDWKQFGLALLVMILPEMIFFIFSAHQLQREE
jgi:ABC-2 type transport system permease protein